MALNLDDAARQGTLRIASALANIKQVLQDDRTSSAEKMQRIITEVATYSRRELDEQRMLQDAQQVAEMKDFLEAIRDANIPYSSDSIKDIRNDIGTLSGECDTQHEGHLETPVTEEPEVIRVLDSGERDTQSEFDQETEEANEQGSQMLLQGSPGTPPSSAPSTPSTQLAGMLPPPLKRLRSSFELEGSVLPSLQ